MPTITKSTDKNVLTLAEAAAYLRTSVPTVKAMAERGEITGRKIGTQGTRWRFLRAALDAYLSGADK